MSALLFLPSDPSVSDWNELELRVEYWGLSRFCLLADFPHESDVPKQLLDLWTEFVEVDKYAKRKDPTFLQHRKHGIRTRHPF